MRLGETIYIVIYFCFSSDKNWQTYFSDWTNWLNILAVVLTLLIIPLRIANLREQWMFVSLAYVAHTLRIFEYAVILS